ncbi:hypothetical protein HanXRQr2_Chr15g0671781 [Helianthus annuus]|uniref:Uncharacterized protein n=1 Tax=Helianthus annuus TaxID=4232 RepID=A0A9K3H2U4_HELAN|nr:hypothetical protein HanXRQr2_Chr15g0671781 [Helianthus annuus]KAJ0829527.1 hypothetical protein HanPSC8_Chr15g0644931 [Helianthus annuus]
MAFNLLGVSYQSRLERKRNKHTHTLAENKEHENLRGSVKVTYVHGLQLGFYFY